MTFEIEILGSEPAWPSALRASSGYLIRTEESTVLIDCGTGVFERLRHVLMPEGLSAIVISHLHFDHWVDLIPLRYYLVFEASTAIRPQLHLPPGAIERLRTITGPVDPAPDFFTGAFETSEYDPQGELRVEDLRITFRRTLHPIETYALKLILEGKTIVYSADTGRDDSFADFVSGADLFVCEATWGAGNGDGEVHLSAVEAGRLAALAGVPKLVLTHLAEPKAESAVEAAQREYRGPVEYAKPGSTFRV